jgi:hypothetical protein
MTITVCITTWGVDKIIEFTPTSIFGDNAHYAQRIEAMTQLKSLIDIYIDKQFKELRHQAISSMEEGANETEAFLHIDAIINTTLK